MNPMTQEMILDGLMSRYIESLVYQGVVENIACEQAAKMVAMKSATDNAGDLIDELQLVYNNDQTGSDNTRTFRNCSGCGGTLIIN